MVATAGEARKGIYRGFESTSLEYSTLPRVTAKNTNSLPQGYVFQSGAYLRCDLLRAEIFAIRIPLLSAAHI
ncbi:hypothetical protein PUN28_017371 [Cardiocondyla obscurior]|uniref:Uncharacterized protein n=1 Tax=Cardiocondyla obscurior TaxID=286306 RepID=A0AAW2EQB7_9HYME